MSDPKALDADAFRFSVEPRIAAPFHDSATDRVVAVFDAHDRAVAVQEVLEAAHDVGVAARHALGQPTDPVPLTRLGDVLRESVAGVLARPAAAVPFVQVDGAEKARADAAERMVVEVKAALVETLDAYEAATAHIKPGSWPSQPWIADPCVIKARAALASTAEVAGRWVHEDEIVGVEMVDRMRAERDAAIAASDEAVRESRVLEVRTQRVMLERDAAERARDEVGIQLAAAQAEIGRRESVVSAARMVDRSHIAGHDLVKPMAFLNAALRALDAVPGDALAPKSRPPEAHVARRLADLEGLLRDAQKQVDAGIRARRLLDGGGKHIDAADEVYRRITAALEASGIDAGNVKGVG